MKVLKYILFAVLGIIVLALVAAAFMKKEYSVKKQVTINRPSNEVYDYIKYLKNQDNYSKWASMDPAMKKSYRGTDGTVGFVSRWESDKDSVGVGEQEIKQMQEGQRVDYELRFIEPFESTEQAYMTTAPAGAGQTTVEWGFNGRMNYPMNLMFLFYDMEEMIGNDLQTGLNRLKVVMENQPTAATR